MNNIDTTTHRTSGSLTFGELRVGERLARAIPQLLAAAAMLCAGTVASAQTTLGQMTVWATYYNGGYTGGGSGGGGWGVNNPTTNNAYTNPPQPPFDCANHIAHRPPSCPMRPAFPAGAQYYGGNLAPGSALDRLRHYIDLAGAGSPNGSRMTDALTHHTAGIVEGTRDQGELNLNLLLDLNIACNNEAAPFAGQELGIIDIRAFARTPEFVRMLSCYDAMEGMRVEMGLAQDLWTQVSNFFSSLVHTTITISPNPVTGSGPGSISITPGELSNSLNQKYTQGRADFQCGLWYFEADLEGCGIP